MIIQMSYVQNNNPEYSCQVDTDMQILLQIS